MRYIELGRSVREARVAREMTQAELARSVGLTRTTVNQFEAGVCPDLGLKKVIRLLAALDLSLDVAPARKRKPPDFLRMACVSANVGFKEQLSPDELAHIVLTAYLPRNRRPHLRHIFEEVPLTVIRGMTEQLRAATPKPERVTDNLRSLATRLGSELRF